jgi:hypothetical protein
LRRRGASDVLMGARWGRKLTSNPDFLCLSMLAAQGVRAQSAQIL